MLAARWTPYVETELLGLAELAGPGSVCLDVGAAAGLYTAALAALAGPSGQVHAVEPLTFAHPVWRRMLRAQAAGNVRQHAVALGEQPGSGMMSVPVGRYGKVTGRSFLTQGSTQLGSNAEFARHEDVPVRVTTLDALCAELGLSRLDFIKIDVEGAELGVLAGGQAAIERFRPALLIEIEARHAARFGRSAEDTMRWLAARGYSMYAWRERWQPVSQIRPGTRNYLFRQPGPAATPNPGASRQSGQPARSGQQEDTPLGAA